MIYDEKDNNEIDASISSDDTDGITWDDLIEYGDEGNTSGESAISSFHGEIKNVELQDGLEGIVESKSDNNVIELENVQAESVSADSTDDINIDEALDELSDFDTSESQIPVQNTGESNQETGDISIIDESHNYEESEIERETNSTNYTETGNFGNNEINPANVPSDNISANPGDEEESAPIVSEEVDIDSLNETVNDIESGTSKILENLLPQKEKSNKLPVVLGVVAAVFVVLALVATFLVFQNNGSSLLSGFGNNNDKIEIEDTQTLGDDFSSNEENIINAEPNSDVPNLNNSAQNNNADTKQNKATEKPKKTEEKVVVNVTRSGRANPFAPTGNINAAGYTVPALGNLAPPTELNEDEEIGKLVDIVCTGILYDNIKPSAIITVGGVDYFVQKGDRVDKFIVYAITPTSVVIRSGSNSYVATIGQAFDIQGEPGKMNYVYNKKSKTVTRQYLSPKEIEVNVKEN